MEIQGKRPATQPSSHQTQPRPLTSSVPTGLHGTPSCCGRGVGRLRGVRHVLTELTAAGAETGLVLLEKVGLIGQCRLEVKNNGNAQKNQRQLQSNVLSIAPAEIQNSNFQINAVNVEGKRRDNSTDRCLPKDARGPVDSAGPGAKRPGFKCQLCQCQAAITLNT